MEGRFAIPFHFAAEFLVLVAALGAALEALRARKVGAGAWSLVQGAGFLALAVAQIAHGSLVVRADGDQIVVAIRAGAFLLLALAARPGEAALSRVAPFGAAAMFYPGADAPFAFASAGLALLVAGRGIAAHRRDQDPSTFAFAAAFIAFAGAEAAVALAPAEGGAAIGFAHAARALGALFCARWLWSSIVRSIRLRFVAAFALVLTIGVLVVATALNVVIGDTLSSEELKRLSDAGQARVESIDTLADTALSSAQLFSSSSDLPSRIAGAERARATGSGCTRRELDPFVAALYRILPPDADLVSIVSRSGRTLGSASASGSRICALPADQEIQIAGSSVVAEALGARDASSPLVLRFNVKGGDVAEQVIALGAAPVKAGRPARVIGSVVTGYRIDRDFLQRVGRDLRADVTLLVADSVAASTYRDATKFSASLRAIRGELRTAREDARVVQRVLDVGIERATVAFVPLRSADGRVIAQIALARQTSALDEAQRRATRVLFSITLLAVLIASVLAWLSGGRVTRPIRALTSAVRDLRGGNLQARAKVRSADEVGTLGAAFNEMAAELERTTGGLRAAAHTEATLRSRMEAILQSMGDGLIATNATGEIVTFNRAAESILGARADKVLGTPLDGVLQGQAGGRPMADAAMTMAFADGAVRGARGRTVPVVMTATPLVDARGDQIGRVIVLRDVSREMQAERMKSEFLANVSHELRTPLTGIMGYAEIMKRKKFPREKVERFLENILESTERLERIVEILVDFAAMEAGRLKPRTEPLEVRPMLDEIAARWRDRSGKHKFVRKGAADLPPILGDQRMLDRTFDELIDNAVKFSPDGGTIEITAEPYVNGTRTRKASKVLITVRDHGIGIEPERMSDLFADFRQLDGSETRSYGGLGLGLAYVQRIVSAHGGEIKVQSTPGKGSAFALVLPAAPSVPAPRRALPRRKR